jgi:hypothetical protein
MDGGGKMTEKIRLNDEQWKKLLSLPHEGETKTHGEPSHVSNRLRSHGLVTQDSQGREHLTEQGIRRLSQGR